MYTYHSVTLTLFRKADQMPTQQKKHLKNFVILHCISFLE